jgi:uncharacterized membrane protein
MGLMFGNFRSSVAWRAILLVALAFSSITYAHDPAPRPIRVGPPVVIESPTGEATSGVAISDRGVVLGTYANPDGPTRSFLWTRRGGFRDIGEFTANALNNCGEVVGHTGQAVGFPSDFRAVLYRNGNRFDLGVLFPSAPEAWSLARGINDAGDVTGSSGASCCVPFTNAFVWTRATGIVRLDGPIQPGIPAHYSDAFDINRRGQVVGGRQVDPESPGLEFPALWTPGSPPRLLESLAHHRFAAGNAINERGEFVGNGGNGTHHGFYWSEATGMVALEPVPDPNRPGTEANRANDIDERGRIVGMIIRMIQIAPGTSTEVSFAALWTSPTQFQIFGEGGSVANAINERGEIVGNFRGRAVLWRIKGSKAKHKHEPDWERICRRGVAGHDDRDDRDHDRDGDDGDREDRK